MTNRADEIAEFKARINLTEYAASLGYSIDRKASSRNSAVMVNDAGDKVVIAMGTDGHWVYFSVRDRDDHGSIIDFIQHRQGVHLGRVRQILRPWVGSVAASPRQRADPRHFMEKLDPVPRDLVRVRARFETMRPLQDAPPFLTDTRHIPASLLMHGAFADCIRTDERANTVFPHFNRDGLCGYEIKNHGFTSFASGGVKGLWSSRAEPHHSRLVVAETAIDALSYAALRGIEHARFASIAGQMNPDQPSLLLAAMMDLPTGGRVVSAMDNDDAGNALTTQIATIFRETGRDDLEFTDDRSAIPGRDWNDELRSASTCGCAPLLG